MSLETLWVISMVAEAAVLIGCALSAWRKAYPLFFTYLCADLSASLLLYGIHIQFPAALQPEAYDYVWRASQLLLVMLRLTLVAECYKRLVNTSMKWRFSHGMVWPAAGLGGFIVYVAAVHDVRWPDSRLETVFNLIAAGHSVLTFSLIGMLVHAWTEVRHTIEFKHACILCLYLALTCAGYYTAGQHTEIVGEPLMAIAVICYIWWFMAIVKAWKTGELKRVA